MRTKLSIAAALVAAPLLWAADAQALTITINGGESPTFPPTFTTLIAGDGPITLAPTACCGAANSFIVSATAAGTPSLPSGQLDSNTIDINSTGAGTLIVWVTETGLTTPLGKVMFTSGLTANTLAGGISSVTLSTFVSSTDGISPPNGTPLDKATFTGIGSQTASTVAATGAGPYSLQKVFTVHATGAGNTSLGIDLASRAVPEPTSLAIVGTGLVGLGLLRKRRRIA